MKDWRDFLNRSLEAVGLVGDLLILVAYTLVSAFGVFVVLIAMLYVEQQRVQHGIALFDGSLSVGGSWALVVLNVVLEVTTFYLENRADYKREPAYEFSLRLFARRAAYFLGLGKDWTPRPLSPALFFHQLARLVTFAILALALAGSMQQQLQDAPGAWHQGVLHVLTQSSLSNMVTWLGGLLFAFAAVLGAQAASRYTAAKAIEIRNQMRARKSVSTRKETVNLPEPSVNLRQMTAIDRPSPKMKIALAHLREHPEDMETESRALGARIGVSHTLANEAKKYIKSEQERAAVNHVLPTAGIVHEVSVNGKHEREGG